MNPAPQTSPTTPQPAQTEGRDTSGRFAKGNPGGPGNPYPRRIAAFRQALLNCITEEDIAAIAKAVIEEAKNGNIPAAKLIFQYVLGKPGDPAEACRLAPIANGANGSLSERSAAVRANGNVGGPSAAPIANGANGNVGEPSAAPIANGSNGGADKPAPSTLGPKAEQWLDRQVRLAMEKLGAEPLVKGI